MPVRKNGVKIYQVTIRPEVLKVMQKQTRGFYKQAGQFAIEEADGMFVRAPKTYILRYADSTDPKDMFWVNVTGSEMSTTALRKFVTGTSLKKALSKTGEFFNS